MVDGLERELGERGQVIRIDAGSTLGQRVAARYQARYLPTFIVTDAQGDVVLNQGGRPSKQELLVALGVIAPN